MILNPTANPGQLKAIDNVLNKSITFTESAERDVSDQDVIDYIQGKFDRMNKRGLFVKQIRSLLKFVVRKKRPKHMSVSRYGNLINKILQDNGYGK